MVEIQILKLLQNVIGIKQNVYCNSYYLNCKYLLQKFIFIFRDMSVCLLWLFISIWMKFLTLLVFVF